MKINDKCLTAFSQLQSFVDRQGYLRKRGEVNSSYKRRWFSLKGNLLFYFEDKNDKSPLGVIVLEQCCVEMSDVEAYSFCIRYDDSYVTNSQSRTYTLLAEDEDDMKNWIRAISSASFTYIQGLVDEFENMLSQLQKVDQVNAPEGAENDYSVLNFPSALNSSQSSSSIDNMDGSSPKLKSKTDMSIVAIVSSAKSRFKSIESKKHKNSDGALRKSRSSENINKLGTSKSLSHGKQKNKALTIKKNYYSYNLQGGDEGVTNEDDEDNSTFETFHSRYGASIWQKIGETSKVC